MRDGCVRAAAGTRRGENRVNWGASFPTKPPNSGDRTISLRSVRACALLLIALLLGVVPCATLRADPATPVDPHFFDYDARAPFTATVTPLRTKAGGVRVLTVTYPSPVVTPFPANNTVTGYLFLPPGPGPHPAMIVLHEWLPVNLNNEFAMCRGMAKAGVAAFLIVQPFSLEPAPAAVAARRRTAVGQRAADGRQPAPGDPGLPARAGLAVVAPGH